MKLSTNAMVRTQPTLLQQFVQFVFVGAIAFGTCFCLLAFTLLSAETLQRDRVALRLMISSFSNQDLSKWLANLATGYTPFFLQQKPLVLAYCVAVAVAFWASWWYDTKILRKEKKL
jgi:hypothetical protein